MRKRVINNDPPRSYPMKTKASITVTAIAHGEFHFAAIRIGETMPFAQGKVKAPNAKRARRFAAMKVEAKMPGFTPYVRGGGAAVSA